ncbi:MAG: SDR family oxidoreductase [Anaerolineae bacterium]|nr:SDR family oxidoreductase [Anaerolineae bacterium]
MTILVIGATGLLGGNLTRQLVEQGEEVRVLARPRQRRKPSAIDGLPVEVVAGDVTDLESVRRALYACRHVYHAAGLLGMGSGEWAQYRRTNVEGTANVCRAAMEAGVERLVYTSTASAVGWSVDGNPVDETAPWNFDRWPVPYIVTKREAEVLVIELVSRGLPAVVVNPTYCFGPWDAKPSTGTLLRVAATGLLAAVPGGGANFVDVRDVARGHILAMARGRVGERYILGGENLSWMEFFRLAAQLLRVRPPRFVFPRWLGVLGGYWADLLARLGMPMPISANGMRTFYVRHFVSSEKAKRELGYRPSSARTAIADAITWMREYGYLRV